MKRVGIACIELAYNRLEHRKFETSQQGEGGYDWTRNSCLTQCRSNEEPPFKLLIRNACIYATDVHTRARTLYRVGRSPTRAITLLQTSSYSQGDYAIWSGRLVRSASDIIFIFRLVIIKSWIINKSVCRHLERLCNNNEIR